MYLFLNKIFVTSKVNHNCLIRYILFYYYEIERNYIYIYYSSILPFLPDELLIE